VYALKRNPTSGIKRISEKEVFKCNYKGGYPSPPWKGRGFSLHQLPFFIELQLKIFKKMGVKGAKSLTLQGGNG